MANITPAKVKETIESYCGADDGDIEVSCYGDTVTIRIDHSVTYTDGIYKALVSNENLNAYINHTESHVWIDVRSSEQK